jgi:hypothetical protein
VCLELSAVVIFFPVSPARENGRHHNPRRR